MLQFANSLHSDLKYIVCNSGDLPKGSVIRRIEGDLVFCDYKTWGVLYYEADVKDKDIYKKVLEASPSGTDLHVFKFLKEEEITKVFEEVRGVPEQREAGNGVEVIQWEKVGIFRVKDRTFLQHFRDCSEIDANYFSLVMELMKKATDLPPLEKEKPKPVVDAKASFEESSEDSEDIIEYSKPVVEVEKPFKKSAFEGPSKDPEDSKSNDLLRDPNSLRVNHQMVVKNVPPLNLQLKDFEFHPQAVQPPFFADDGEKHIKPKFNNNKPVNLPKKNSDAHLASQDGMTSTSILVPVCCIVGAVGLYYRKEITSYFSKKNVVHRKPSKIHGIRIVRKK
eukprot:GHVP01010680.1.p1 GENE.GHVP01010680.1~~GHVP01010680.1.p1  ORF type:complete len:336 (+),score=60.55 GHVP01010680.1:911-1918(+)